MEPNKIVSRDEWLIARKELLAKELEMTHALDVLRAQRRELPWERVEKSYVFNGPAGRLSLAAQPNQFAVADLRTHGSAGQALRAGLATRSSG